MRFIEAKNYTRGRIKPVRLIVWHDMEAPENRTTAENVAKWFAGSSAPQASAHICADPDSVVECVKPNDTAWHAPGANADGIGIELAGYSRQSAAEWLDATSRATIDQAAAYAARVMKGYGIPARWLTDEQLRGGSARGMTTHRQVSRVFRKSDHTDPGANFPYAYVLNAVTGRLGPDAGHVHPTIRRGSSGAAVEHAQQLLNARGASPRLTVDGDFGPRTEQETRDFQKRAGLVVDGIIGPKTWAALEK